VITSYDTLRREFSGTKDKLEYRLKQQPIDGALAVSWLRVITGNVVIASLYSTNDGGG
jgi:hypothetical protein